jgi:hypothetical protein
MAANWRRAQSIWRTWPTGKRFITGLSKEDLLADTLAQVARAFRPAPGDLSTVPAWLGIIAFALQIYYIFGLQRYGAQAGTDAGLQIRENFNYTYISTGIADYGRWHISFLPGSVITCLRSSGGGVGARWRAASGEYPVRLLMLGCGTVFRSTSPPGAAATAIVWK